MYVGETLGPNFIMYMLEVSGAEFQVSLSQPVHPICSTAVLTIQTN